MKKISKLVVMLLIVTTLVSSVVFAQNSLLNRENYTVTINSPITESPAIKVTGRTLVNMLGTDGDLSDTTNMTIIKVNALNGEVTSEQHYVGSGSLYFNKENQNGYVYKDNIYFDKDHKYYYSGYQFMTEFDNNTMSKIYLMDTGTFDKVKTVGKAVSPPNALNTWEKHSLIFQPDSSRDYRLLIYGGGSATYKGYFDAVQVIDLTETFGVGNEPSVEWCDKYMPDYVSGIQPLQGIQIHKTNENIAEGNIVLGGIIWANGDNYNTSSKRRTDEFISVRPNTQYICNKPLYGWGAYDENYSFIKTSQSNTIVTPENTRYIRVVTVPDNTEDISIVEGKTVPETYKAPDVDNMTLPVQLNSLYQFSDELIIKSGRASVIYNVGIKEIKDEDIGQIGVNWTNVDYIHINLSNESVTKDSNFVFNTNTNRLKSSYNPSSDHTRTVMQSSEGLYFTYPKGTSIENIKNELIGKKIMYKLETPVTQEISYSGSPIILKPEINEITVDSGYVREKANVVKSETDGKYYINIDGEKRTDIQDSELDHKAMSIKEISIIGGSGNDFEVVFNREVANGKEYAVSEKYNGEDVYVVYKVHCNEIGSSIYEIEIDSNGDTGLLNDEMYEITLENQKEISELKELIKDLIGVKKDQSLIFEYDNSGNLKKILAE
ncbi:hypothetical protein [Fusibacter sp. JL216-2]|uniref:hypothetical protein n=1 Tax=Fusibacter sp. JL216-2 TaxID=3071453 RepID=UPI003D336DA9